MCQPIPPRRKCHRSGREWSAPSAAAEETRLTCARTGKSNQRSQASRARFSVSGAQHSGLSRCLAARKIKNARLTAGGGARTAISWLSSDILAAIFFRIRLILGGAVPHGQRSCPAERRDPGASDVPAARSVVSKHGPYDRRVTSNTNWRFIQLTFSARCGNRNRRDPRFSFGGTVPPC
jgi:hypothetical protein